MEQSHRLSGAIKRCDIKYASDEMPEPQRRQGSRLVVFHQTTTRSAPAVRRLQNWFESESDLIRLIFN